jgi:2-polyprenyl-3-methyl-5-hydroxy-6-metoxy-1,4-benzoquinol methylase
MKFISPKEIVVTSEDDNAIRLFSKISLIRWLYQRRYVQTAEALEPQAHSRILEIGCGSGILYPTLKNLGFYVGLDLHSRLNLVKRKLGGEYVKGDLRHLPFKRKFDCVICLSVLEHIKELDTALDEVGKVAKDEARLVFGIPHDNLLVKAWFWLKKSPALETHINSRKRLVSKIGAHFRVEKKRLSWLGPFPFYTLLVCRPLTQSRR